MREADEAMMSSYRSGTWTGLVAPGGLALLAPDFAAVTARSLWEAMVAERPLSAWLEAIAGGGLSALPDFALVQTEGAQVRILVRGRVGVDCDGTQIRAEGMSTWREHVGPLPQHLRISGPEEGGQEWPLGSGVVSAAAVQIGSEDEQESPTFAGTDATSEDEPEAPEQPLEQVAPVEGAETPDEVGAGNVEGPEAPDGPEPDVGDVEGAETPDEPEAEDVEGAETPDEPEAEAEDVEGAETPDEAEAEAEAEPEAEPGDAVESDGQTAGSGAGGDRGLIDSLPWNVPAMKAQQTSEGEGAGASQDQDDEAAVDDEAAEDAAPVDDAVDADLAETPHSDQPSPASDSDYISEATVFPAYMVGGDAATGEHETDDADDADDADGEDDAEEGADGQDAGQANEDDGDHDGHTVLVAHLRDALNAGGEGVVGEDTVLAGAESQPARVVPVLVLSTGERVELDRPALLGRAPEATRFEGPVAPHLVTVPSPQQDISRTHVELRPEGDHVVVTDLRSTNGTVVTLPGAEARRLHPSEAIPVGAGAVIDLGDGLTAQVQIDTGGEESQPAPDAGTGQPTSGQQPAAPVDPYGQPAPYGQPTPYAQPEPYGQPPAPGGPSQPGPYGPPPQGPGVPPPPGPYGSAGAAGAPGPGVSPYGPSRANPYGPYQGGAR